MPELGLPQADTGRSAVDDDNLDHSVCEHDLDTALCGTDVHDAPWVEDGTDQCIVCADLENYYDQIGTCCRLGEAEDRG